MKRLFAIAVLVLLAMPAMADVMLSFKDGTRNVWTAYYAKGKEYCTKKEFGEYCVQKSDVVSIKEVPAGTEASVYGITSGGDSELLEQRREENSAALKSLNCTQLKASNTAASKAQYRNECFTPEEKKAWNEKVRRDEDRQRAVLRDVREIQRDDRERQKDWERDFKEQQRDRERDRKESDREWKERQRDDKLDRIDRTLRGY